MSIASILLTANHTITTQRPGAAVSDTGGRISGPFVDVNQFSPCWMQPASSRIRLSYQERQINVTHRAYFNADPGVAAEWRLKMGNRLFRVIGAANTAELGRLWTVDCEETLVG